MWWRIEQTWSWTWKLTRNLLKLGKEPFEMKKGEKGYVKNLRNIIYLCYRMVPLRYYMYFNLSSLVIGMRWIIACRDLLRSTFRRNSCKQVRKQRKTVLRSDRNWPTQHIKLHLHPPWFLYGFMSCPLWMCEDHIFCFYINKLKCGLCFEGVSLERSSSTAYNRPAAVLLLYDYFDMLT